MRSPHPAGPPERRNSRSHGCRRLRTGDVVSDQAEVVIIGGGATGIGLLWDLHLRGFDVVLVEQGGLVSGTSGAFHGLLHSGARYAVTDPQTARECLAENRRLTSLAKTFVSRTGGIFARLEDDPAEWEKTWLEGCAESGIRTEPISRRELLTAEPHLTSRIVSAYRVPDATIDGFGLLWSLAWSAAEGGARIYLGARAVGLLTDDIGVRGVLVASPPPSRTGAGQNAALGVDMVEPGEVIAPVVVNATGPWAAETASLAGPEAGDAVPIHKDKGVMVVFNTRLVSAVINRLRRPSDGDILVPHGPVTILGTTSTAVEWPEQTAARVEEIRILMREGLALLPGLPQAPPLRAYAGIRPLLRPTLPGIPSAAPRSHGRGFLMVDHGQSGGPAGLITVCGGKFTTLRAMAETAGDLVAASLGRRVPSRSASVGMPRLIQDPLHVPAEAGGRDRPLTTEALACECELVADHRVASLLGSGLSLDDIRRLARAGMGGCQGVFCSARLRGALWATDRPDGDRRRRPGAPAVIAEIGAFQDNRRRGVEAVEWGAQARLAALSEALERLTLGESGRGGAGSGSRRGDSS